MGRWAGWSVSAVGVTIGYSEIEVGVIIGCHTAISRVSVYANIYQRGDVIRVGAAVGKRVTAGRSTGSREVGCTWHDYVTGGSTALRLEDKVVAGGGVVACPTDRLRPCFGDMNGEVWRD